MVQTKDKMIKRIIIFLAAALGKARLKDGESIDQWINTQNQKSFNGAMDSFLTEITILSNMMFPDKVQDAHLEAVVSTLSSMISQLASHVSDGNQDEKEEKVAKKLFEIMERLYNLTHPRKVRVARKVYHETSCLNVKDSMQEKDISSLANDIVHADCCDPTPQPNTSNQTKNTGTGKGRVMNEQDKKLVDDVLEALKPISNAVQRTLEQKAKSADQIVNTAKTAYMVAETAAADLPKEIEKGVEEFGKSANKFGGWATKKAEELKQEQQQKRSKRRVGFLHKMLFGDPADKRGSSMPQPRQNGEEDSDE